MKRLKDFILFEQVVTEKTKEGNSLISGFDIMSLDDFVQKETGIDPDEKIEEAAKKDMLGAETRKLPDDELQDYLGRVTSKTKDKKDKFKYPFIHGGNISIKDVETKKEFDLKKLADQIMIRPKQLLKQNEKMEHSDGSVSVFFNIGLPAIKGLAFDEKKKEFVVVNTCPGAGECKIFCYATKGGYVQWKSASMSQTRVLNFLLNDPDGFKKQLVAEIGSAEKKFTKKKNIKVVVRWHDAGDFFSPDYMNLAFAVAEKFPAIDFYAYTKMADVAKAQKPQNFIINFSQGATPQQQKQIDFVNIKHSKVVPVELFKDLSITAGGPGKPRARVEDPEKIETLKDRVAEKFNINKDTILTYSEMMNTPEGDKQKWNVIVMVGDGDDSANRKDVLGTYLLAH